MADEFAAKCRHLIASKLAMLADNVLAASHYQFVGTGSCFVAELFRPHAGPSEVVIRGHGAADIDELVDRHVGMRPGVFIVGGSVIRLRKPAEAVLFEH